MARVNTSDFLQNFRFHVQATLAGPGQPGVLSFDDGNEGNAEAGFNQAPLPEYTVNNVEYRNGLKLHTIQQPGIPETNDITLQRGAVKKHSVFMQWLLQYFKGGQYRADIRIHQWGHNDYPSQEGDGFDETKGRKYVLREAFPIRVKPASDLDATSDDIAMAEIDIKFEKFDMYIDDTKVDPSTDQGVAGEGITL